MRAGPLARGASWLVDAKVAFGGFEDRCSGNFVAYEIAPFVSYLDHPDVIVRAGASASSAANARGVVNDDIAGLLITVDGACGAADHANRIGAMHTRVGDHEVVEFTAVPDETWIVVVSLCTSIDAGVAAHASVEIDEHGLGAVDEAVFH